MPAYYDNKIEENDGQKHERKDEKIMNGIKTIILLASMLLTMSSAPFSGNINIKMLFEQLSPSYSASVAEEKAVTEFLPIDNDICRTYGHEKGTYLGTYEDTRNIDSGKYCYYGVDVITYLCQRCNAQFTVEQGEYYALHDKEYSCPGETAGDFRCRSCGYEGRD